MKSTDKITNDILIDLLKIVGLEKDGEGDCMFYCRESEKSIDIRTRLRGDTLGDLLDFIKNYNYDMGYKYGTFNGKRNKMNEIKRVLEINQYG